MKLRIVLFVLCVLVLLVLAAAPMPNQTIDNAFPRHRDFPCVKQLQAGTAPTFNQRVPQLDAFAKEKNLDADRVQCYFFVRRFENGEWARKNYYHRTLTLYDQKALHYADVNQTTYELGGQPVWDYMNVDGTRPLSGHWQRYPLQYLMFE